MSDETKVRVRLDTRQAKTEMRTLSREGRRTSERLSTNLRSTVRRGLGVVGLGGAIGAGVAAVRGPVGSGFGAVIGESLGGLGAQLTESLFGTMTEAAAATRQAREETTAAFGLIQGLHGKDSLAPGVQNFFDSTKAIREKEAAGREVFERELRDKDLEIDKVLKRITDALATELKKAVDGLASRLLQGF